MSSPPPPPDHREDPVYRNSLRDARFGMSFWAIATTFVCVSAYLTGYQRAGRTLTEQDIRPVWGIPSWFLWSVMIPWVVCSVICVVYAGFIMTDDDLGADHTEELEQEIREGTDVHELA
jgi:uncharacterized membrane protein YhdT